MKKQILKQINRFLLIYLVCILCVGCASNTTKTEVVDALADGVLKVGIIVGDDSFSYKENNEYKGIEPNILTIFSKNENIELEYIECNNQKELLSLLDEGKIELASGKLIKSNDAESKYFLSSGYKKVGIYIATKKGKYMNSFVSLNKGKIGISLETPSFLTSQIDNISQNETNNYSNILTLINDIQSLKIDAAIVTEREALDMIESGDIQVSEIVNGPRYTTVFYMINGDYNLKEKIDLTINYILDEKARVK